SIVWSKFDKLIPQGSTVFFSPDMQLHSFPLENLPDYSEDGKLIGERWKLHRLSSTRQIAKNPQNGKKDGVEIFGGIDYSFDPGELVADYNKNVSGYRAYSDDSENLRAGITRIKALPGSKREVAEIARVLKGNATPVSEYTGKTGTEARFKASAGKNGNVLHISTHGFFLNPSNVGGRLANLLSLSGKQSLSYDDALTGSGLMMAGVNEVITGKVSTDECEDGLLTSKEISRMDLSDIDFAVLSACETGVGAVSGEGVFGLQRGFKLAGVNSIMMSLWKVDDDATEKLMTEFYRNWVENRDSRKSLKIAQEAVRKTPGWEHPKYWAGFILLD
ncbi:MAG: CHAT domain-containing protein, partial [Muribaculaceae bacterium]|nr:CHAT domain-containing protein [Muribaculaceae bacterium]